MQFKDYMIEFYKEKYRTDDIPKDIEKYVGRDFDAWMNYKLTEKIGELIEVLKGKKDA